MFFSLCEYFIFLLCVAKPFFGLIDYVFHCENMGATLDICNMIKLTESFFCFQPGEIYY